MVLSNRRHRSQHSPTSKSTSPLSTSLLPAGIQDWAWGFRGALDQIRTHTSAGPEQAEDSWPRCTPGKQTRSVHNTGGREVSAALAGKAAHRSSQHVPGSRGDCSQGLQLLKLTHTSLTAWYRSNGWGMSTQGERDSVESWVTMRLADNGGWGFQRRE